MKQQIEVELAVLEINKFKFKGKMKNRGKDISKILERKNRQNLLNDLRKMNFQKNINRSI